MRPVPETRGGRGSATKPGHRGRLLFCTLLLALAAGACRESVVLDQISLDGGSSNSDGGGQGGAQGGGGGAGGGFMTCTSLTSPSSVQYPNVMFALDHSMAMLTQFANGGDSRLGAAQDEILMLANQYQAILRLGYVEFPAPGGCTSGGCCAGDPTFPTRFNQNQIYAAMQICNMVPGGCMSAQRPIADALIACMQTYNQLANDGHNRYVILMTADDPACSSDNMPCLDAQGQVASLANADVTTYVVGMGSDLSSTMCLDKLATAGRAQRTSGPPFYYPVHSTTDLQTTLGAIADAIAHDACTIVLDSPPFDQSKVQVSLNGQALISGDPNGWGFVPHSNNQMIQLNGTACDTVVGSSKTPDVSVCQFRSH